MPEKTYQKITDAIVCRLKEIVGERYVIFGDEEKLEPFSHDEVPDKKYARMPEAVVRPRTAQEIAAIMKLANRENIPVTPRGAGSGLSGGAVPLYGGVVLATDRMNEILEIDTANMMVVVEPGVIANEINEKLKGTGLFYAGYPMSMETCYIGGNVAENAGGGKAVKYGVTSRYVLGLEIVTPTGEIVELGGKLVKDVTGYNLIQLMTGSEGTLGIFTKIVLRLMPQPKAQVDLLCLFETAEQAIDAVPKVTALGGVTPTSIEFMDRDSVKAACDYLNESLPYQKAQAMLIISVDGPERDQVERDYELLGNSLEKMEGLIEIYVADNPTTSERVWKVRRNIAEAYNVISGRQCNEDIVVPPARIPDLLKVIQELKKKYGVMIPTYGHAGDGNLHSRISAPMDWNETQWETTLPKLLDELYASLKLFGGRISGEHGIGHKRKKYMTRVVSEEYMGMLRAIKRALDPNYVLNPGKIFDL